MENIYAPPFNKDNFKHYLQLAEFEAAFKGEDFKSWSEDTKTQKAKEQHQRRLKSWDSIIGHNLSLESSCQEGLGASRKKEVRRVFLSFRKWSNN